MKYFDFHILHLPFAVFGTLHHFYLSRFIYRFTLTYLGDIPKPVTKCWIVYFAYCLCCVCEK